MPRLPTQLVLRVPEEAEEKLREKIKKRDMADVELRRSNDNLEDPDPSKSITDKLYELVVEDDHYPARLVNLPCVVEVHKTIDNSTLYKCGDIGQMIIAYKDEVELKTAILKEREALQKDSRAADDRGDKDKAGAKSDGPRLDYYPSGLTPPTTGIVRRRFMETRTEGPYAPEVVSRVQLDLQKHLAATQGNGNAALSTEVLEDVVPFEAYMADHEGKPVTFSEDHGLWREHPEVMIHRPVEYTPPPPSPPPPPPPAPAPAPAPPPLALPAKSPKEKKEEKKKEEKEEKEKPAAKEDKATRRERSRAERAERAAQEKEKAKASKGTPDKKDSAPLDDYRVGGVRQPPWMDRARPIGKPPPPPPGPPPPPPPPMGTGGDEAFIMGTEADDFLADLDDMVLEETFADVVTKPDQT